MANKKISQLTTTTTADDNSWIVMNDSGNTATYRITRSDLLAGTDIAGGLVNGTGTNSLKSADNLTTTAAVSSNTNSIALGNGAKASGSNSITIGTTSVNSGNNSINIGLHYNSADNVINIGNGAYTYQANGISIGQSSGSQQGGIVLGNSSRAGKTGSLTFGNNNEHNQGNYSVSIGNEVRNGIAPNYYGAEYSVAIGHNHKLEGNTENGQNYSTILGGSGNVLTGNTTNVVLLGLNNFTSPATDNTTYLNKLVGIGNSTIVNTRGTTNTETASSLSNFVVGEGNDVGTINKRTYTFGYNNANKPNSGFGGELGNFIFGDNNSATNNTNNYLFGRNHNVSGGSNMAFGDNMTISSNNNIALGGQYHNLSSSNYSAILGGYDNDITGSGGAAGILVGEGNDITASGAYNTIIGSATSTISGSLAGASIIASNSKSALYSYTLHAENNHTFKTESFDVVAVGNVGGNIDVDCSLGTIFTFTMTADTTPNFINLRTGQRFIFIVENTTYAVPGATINGASGNVYAKNGNINPSSNAITKYTATYDGTRMFLDEELNFQSV